MLKQIPCKAMLLTQGFAPWWFGNSRAQAQTRVRPSRLLILFLLTWFTTFILLACSNSGADRGIRVGSKDFTEQLILGEMYASVLENKGFKVERKFNLGGTAVTQASLEKGEVDMYPEYTGTALLAVLKLPSNSNLPKVYETVAKAYKEKFNLVWLQPAPMNNTFALCMTTTGAKKYGIKTISDMVAKASELTMVGAPEFQQREDGLPGLRKVYGNFELKKYLPVDPGLRYQGLNSGQVDIVVGAATDGEINALNLVVIKDDKNFFPPYQVAPVVRQEVIEKNSEIEGTLNSLSAKITTETMQKLNYEVTGKKQEPTEVAKTFLKQEGLLK